MRKLLEKKEFEWVKNKLLPLFGLINIGNREEDGKFGKYFIIPLSKENIIYNLIRTTQYGKEEINSKLKEFEKRFDKFIDIKEKSNKLIYHAPSRRKHSSVTRKCLDPEDLGLSSEFYILREELATLSKRTIDSLGFNTNKIFRKLIHNTTTINQVILLALLSEITDKLSYLKFYQLDTTKYSPTKEDLRKILRRADIDREFIEVCIEYTNYDELYQLLSYDKLYFAIIYSHDFNAGTCYRHDNLLILKSVAEVLNDKLKKIDFISYLSANYKKIKNSLINDNDRLPLFNYRDEKMKFFSEYYHDILTPQKLNLFNIDKHHKMAFMWFKDKGFFNIENDLITLKPDMEYNFKSYYLKLKYMEDERIQKNKKDLLDLWLNLQIELEKDFTTYYKKVAAYTPTKIEEVKFKVEYSTKPNFTDEMSIRKYALKLSEMFLKNPSEKNLNKLLESLNQVIKDWSLSQKNVLYKEFQMFIEAQKKINPRWKKYGKNLLNALGSVLGPKLPL